MQFSLHLEQQELSDREDSLVHLLLRLETPPLHEVGRHTPLLVALVIDRSKSMQGEKLRSVVEASHGLVNWLSRNDSLAVIAYDTNVEVIQPLLPLTDKFSVMKRIEGIQAGSSTNLSGGWLQGLRMIEEAATPGAFRRVVLLTDGMANAGIVRPADLTQIAREHFQRGISTTTIGFGRDFSEKLLTEIATNGGGNFYFIEGPEQANAVFFREFGEIAGLYGQGLEIRLRFCEGVRLAEILHEVPWEEDGQTVILRPGDLRSDDLQSLVMVLEVQGTRASRSSEPLVSGECSFYNVPAGARMERVQAEIRPGFSARPSGEINTEVQVEMLIASTSRALLEASRLSTEQDLPAARELLRHMRRRIEESLSLNPDVLGRLNERLKSSEHNLDENLAISGKRLTVEAIESLKEVRRPFSSHDRILEIPLSGQLDMYNSPDLKSRVGRAMENGYRFAIIDMTELTYIDSSGIGALIQIFNWLKNRDGLLVFANIQGSVERIFQISRLDEFFVYRDSHASARMLIEDLLQPE